MLVVEFGCFPNYEVGRFDVSRKQAKMLELRQREGIANPCASKPELYNQKASEPDVGFNIVELATYEELENMDNPYAYATIAGLGL